MYKEDLIQIAPNSSILDDVFSLHEANTATFPTDSRNKLIVKPQSVKEVVGVVKFAVQHKLKLYTVSKGKNWGFGSKVPVQDGTILLDLSLMDNIISYDKQFGTVRVEPGVTFRQLSEYLIKEGGHHFLNTIGGDPEASVLGNILERGDGVGPYCERSEYASRMELVLTNGKVLETGFGSLIYSRVADLCKTGVGPGLQELFFQSNLAITTKITVWLHPLPKFFRTFSFAQEESHSLALLLDQIRALYSKRVINSPITCWNDYKQLAASHQLSSVLQEHTPLRRSQIKEISNNYSTWYAFGGIYVDHERIGKAVLQELFKALKPYIKKKTYWSQLSTRKIKILRTFHNFWGFKQLDFEKIITGWDNSHLLGNTAGNSIKTLFWRKKSPAPPQIDPGPELCGVLWNAFLIPFDGSLIEEVLGHIDELILQHGFEPILSFVLLNDRYVKVFQQLIFDRENEGEDQAAMSCHSAVFSYVEQMGCSHTRLDILHMEEGKKRLKDDGLHQIIKQALDPEGILSPGRYFC